MSRTLLEDAFEHHVWATLRLIDTCLTLSPSELERAVPGTYGTILDTQRHVVGSDSWYLFDITGDRARRIEEDLMDLPELRTAACRAETYGDTARMGDAHEASPTGEAAPRIPPDVMAGPPPPRRPRHLFPGRHP
jgi:uncharacterized damage-inducible protein DinB